ncbi:hypothetical protein ACJMK2_025355 [Sinanodonta woodiana]|uniref:Uncharacterized protein n=1 Tax=Sinanodonta woodiana TaxID=1069815 RepID=A0ABD3XI59_SINWO
MNRVLGREFITRPCLLLQVKMIRKLYRQCDQSQKRLGLFLVIVVILEVTIIAGIVKHEHSNSEATVKRNHVLHDLALTRIITTEKINSSNSTFGDKKIKSDVG